MRAAASARGESPRRAPVSPCDQIARGGGDRSRNGTGSAESAGFVPDNARDGEDSLRANSYDLDTGAPQEEERASTLRRPRGGPASGRLKSSTSRFGCSRNYSNI